MAKRRPQLYGLYKLIGYKIKSKRAMYVRVDSLTALPLETARRIYQGKLLGSALGSIPETYELRPIAKGIYGQ